MELANTNYVQIYRKLFKNKKVDNIGVLFRTVKYVYSNTNDET